jgi:hypothetical protein
MLLCTFVKKYTPLYFRQKKHNLSKKYVLMFFCQKTYILSKKMCSYIFKHVHLSKLICSYALLSKKNIVNMLFCL